MRARTFAWARSAPGLSPNSSPPVTPSASRRRNRPDPSCWRGLGGLTCVVATLLCLIVRFYFSRGEKGLQLKWFTYAAVVGLSTPLLLSSLAPGLFQLLGQLAWTLGFLSLPVSAGLAILR